MKTVLITGAGKRSFIGRNLAEAFQQEYRVLTPPHAELELLDQSAVERYVLDHGVDVIVHAAVHVPGVNGVERELFNDLTMFHNLTRLSGKVAKILYFGSGAEYDKRSDIRMISEDDFGRSVPASEYGLAKYTMNEIARRSENIYNLRLFGVFGKHEDWRIKFLSNLCCKALFDLPLTVRRDCYFDFLHIDDLIAVTRWFMEHEPQYHDYNVCSGQEYRLTALAQKVLEISGKSLPITLLSQERNLDYSADNARLAAECPSGILSTIDTGLRKVYNYYAFCRDEIDVCVLQKSR